VGAGGDVVGKSDGNALGEGGGSVGLARAISEGSGLEAPGEAEGSGPAHAAASRDMQAICIALANRVMAVMIAPRTSTERRM